MLPGLTRGAVRKHGWSGNSCFRVAAVVLQCVYRFVKFAQAKILAVWAVTNPDTVERRRKREQKYTGHLAGAKASHRLIVFQLTRDLTSD